MADKIGIPNEKLKTEVDKKNLAELLNGTDRVLKKLNNTLEKNPLRCRGSPGQNKQLGYQNKIKISNKIRKQKLFTFKWNFFKRWFDNFGKKDRVLGIFFITQRLLVFEKVQKTNKNIR